MEREALLKDCANTGKRKLDYTIASYLEAILYPSHFRLKLPFSGNLRQGSLYTRRSPRFSIDMHKRHGGCLPFVISPLVPI